MSKKKKACIPLKKVPDLLPMEQYLRTKLPTIVGHLDYRTMEEEICRVDDLLRRSGLEEEFIRLSLAHRLPQAVERYQDSYKHQLVVQEHSRRALRCTILKTLLNCDFRELSVRIAESPLFQHFVGIDQVDKIQPPSKSTLERYAKWLPESAIRPMVNTLSLQACEPKAKRKQQVLGLMEPISVDAYFFDTTCVRGHIHFPVDWVLLIDAVRTLTKATERIREHGLKHRMEEPSVFRKRANQLAMTMSQMGRRKTGGKKERKRILRSLKVLARLVKGHAQRHRDLLEKEWQQTDLSEGQARVILERMDNILQQLPQAIKQAHERIIGERQVTNGDKILSLYDEDMHVIVRGKAGADVEFGNTLRLGETQEGLIIDWKLYQEQAPADCKLVEHSISEVQSVFDDRVGGIVADRGCDSLSNEGSLKFIEMRNGICPKDPKKRQQRMQEVTFAEWQKRRSQTEGRIAILKSEFLGKPFRSEGFEHRELAVTWGVLVHNLWVLARLPRCGKKKKQASSRKSKRVKR